MSEFKHIAEPDEMFGADYPFVREVVGLWDGEGYSRTVSWKPGVRWVQTSIDDSDAVADGIGKIILIVVSVHKPGRFPARIFFERQWINPDGKPFGKGGCRVTTVAAFKRLTRGYRHPYRLATAEERAEHAETLEKEAA